MCVFACNFVTISVILCIYKCACVQVPNCACLQTFVLK